MARYLNSIPLLYLALLAPGWLSIFDLVHGTWYYPQMMRESGVISIWYLVMSLAVTPALMLINRLGHGKVLGIWLLKRRKHFGLASFGFATVHVLHYVRYTDDLIYMVREAAEFEYLIGWIGYAVFAVLAATSNRASARQLGPNWKALHRLIYPASALIFLHWFYLKTATATFVYWLSVLVAIKAIHLALATAREARQRRQQPA